MFRLLDRYVFRECLGPFSIGLLVFTFMLLISLMFRLAEMIIQRDVPAGLVAELVAMNLPNILVLTIPMALLFGVLIAIGRLSSDSELIAMRSSGISLFALYRPVMIFSILATLLTGWLILDVMPKGNKRVESIFAEVTTMTVNKQVQPGTFYDGLASKILFVFGVDDNGWEGVFLSEALPARKHDVQVARRGKVSVFDDDKKMQLDLSGTFSHFVDLDEPRKYSVNYADQTSVVIADEMLEKEANRLENRNYKSMTVAELREWQSEPDTTARQKRLAETQIHKQFAIPAACIVFALFAVPLGFNNRRGGRSSGFALSVPIILVYHILQSNGEGAATEGQMAPWLAMWLPNILFLFAGLFLLARKNRDKSMLFSRVDHWVRHTLWAALRKRGRLRQRRKFRRKEQRAEKRAERLAAHRQSELESGGFSVSDLDDDDEAWPDEYPVATNPSGGTADLVLLFPRLRLTFPTLIDRYLLSTFFRVFFLVVLSGATVYILADLTEIFDDVLENEIDLSVVIDYYQVLVFEVLRDLSPLTVLLTILIGFGILSRTSEIVAAKAAGLSLYRLSAPALFAAALVAGGNIVLESFVLPYSTARAEELKAEIGGREPIQRSYRRADRQWLFGAGGYIYHFQNFDPSADRLQRLHVFHFNQDTYELDARLYAQEAIYRADGRWAISGAWSKRFDGDRVVADEQAVDGQLLDMAEEPEFFDMEVRAPAHMNRQQLKRHVQTLKLSGQETHQLEVQLHNKVALPVISFVMAFVALPFAFRLGKKGALYGVGLAIGIGILFYAVVATFTTLGQAGSLPPLVATWSPHVLFASISLYMFLGIET